MATEVDLMSGNILHIVSIGEQTAEDVRKATHEVDRLIKEHDITRIRYLVDFTYVGRITPDARQAFRERTARMAVKGKIRYAILGKTPVLAGLLQMFARASRANAVLKFFKSEDDALIWLDENG
ncbi:STAS/SEC14 domain-containing protein [candidate division WOR-3 bacterium]|nr:STAS/SEC14 domain-containing protein [candidate division WOR-3 bacterium]